MDDSQLSCDTHADEPITDVDAWLRCHLGRRLTVAFVSAEPLDDNIQRLATALERYDEIRALAPQLGEEPGRFVDMLPAADPDVVLLAASTLAVDERQVCAILDGLERRGILDRTFVALIGHEVTRAQARLLGFEDGFPARIAPEALAVALAHEGLAVDERRRRGSSPPCYL
jgi:hypothetical protein